MQPYRQSYERGLRLLYVKEIHFSEDLKAYHDEADIRCLILTGCIKITLNLRTDTHNGMVALSHKANAIVNNIIFGSVNLGTKTSVVTTVLCFCLKSVQRFMNS